MFVYIYRYRYITSNWSLSKSLYDQRYFCRKNVLHNMTAISQVYKLALFSNATWFCLRLKTFMFIYIKYVLFKKIQDKGKTTLVKLLANKTVDQHRKSIIREEITLAAKKDFPVSCCHNWFLLTIFCTSVAHAICGILSNVHDSVHSFK